MEAPHLQRFLDEYQGESKTLQEVETLMNLYVKDKGNPPKFSLKHFFQYLFDEGSNLPIDSKVRFFFFLNLSRLGLLLFAFLPVVIAYPFQIACFFFC